MEMPRHVTMFQPQILCDFPYQLNRAEFEELDEELRVQLEGYRPGLYARVQINNIPCEFVKNFDPTYPIILGGLLSAEQNIGYVHVGISM